MLACQDTPWAAIWAGLEQAIVVTKTDDYQGETTHSTRVYLTSLRTTDVALLATGIRGHWGVENKVHRTRDVHFRQDRNRITHRVAATNLAILNTLALNFLLAVVDQLVCFAQIWLAQNFKQQLTEQRI